MKTLATCSPKEFISQTIKIKRHAESWLKSTDILGIRATIPELKKLPKGATAEEIEEIRAENMAKVKKQSRENLSKMFDAVFEKEPDKTIELLALCCFIEPAEANDTPMNKYMEAITSLISDAAVLNFFTSLLLLGQTLGLDASKISD